MKVRIVWGGFSNPYFAYWNTSHPDDRYWRWEMTGDREAARIFDLSKFEDVQSLVEATGRFSDEIVVSVEEVAQ